MKPQALKPAVGILMLETRFPRIKGDIGNPETFSYPVSYRTVEGASPDRVIVQNANGLLEPFLAAGHELAAEGCLAVTTSCGFLVRFQAELAAALPVPVMTSSLLQVELINRLLPKNKCAGILTIAASNLDPELLALAGVPPQTPVGTTEGGQEFTRAIMENRAKLDIDAARADNVEAALKLCGDHPEVGAIVLECTNMAPYAGDISNAVGLPVFSIVDFLNWFQGALVRPSPA